MPLIDYIQTIGNFNAGYLSTGFYGAGYYDDWNLNTVDFASSQDKMDIIANNRRSEMDVQTGNSTTYDFLFRPPAGILNSIKPLAPKFEMIISFDRAISDLSLINKATDSTESLTGKVLEIKNVILKARYYSSPYLRNYFSTIAENDISYYYDECVVYHKNLPQGETNIRLSNVIGGNTPKYLFAGIINTKALNGDCSLSSTGFQRHGVSEFDLTLNGYSCNGFPINSNNGSPLNGYEKFLLTTGRKFQTNSPMLMTIGDYKQFHYLYSHKFEGETSESGWIGINIKLETAFSDNNVLGSMICNNYSNITLILVIWTSQDVELKLDRFHRIEKIIH